MRLTNVCRLEGGLEEMGARASTISVVCRREGGLEDHPAQCVLHKARLPP